MVGKSFRWVSGTTFRLCLVRRIPLVYQQISHCHGWSLASQNCKLSAWAYMPNEEDLIQAINAPGGVVMSPIEVTNVPLSVKELQLRYYDPKPKLRIRRGPASLDEDRLTNKIDYEVPPAGFPYPVSLVSPPILLQTRRERTSDCNYALGLEYNNKVWDSAVSSTCHAPYACPDNLMTEATSLMACSSANSPGEIFRQITHQRSRHKPVLRIPPEYR